MKWRWRAWNLNLFWTATRNRYGDQAVAINRLVIDGKIDPCLSNTFSSDEIGEAHQLMHENRHPYGNMAALVDATEPGQGKS